jgi:hypothetical protein
MENAMPPQAAPAGVTFQVRERKRGAEKQSVERDSKGIFKQYVKPEQGLFSNPSIMNEKFRTADIVLATVILSLTSAHLISVGRKDGEAIFVFRRSEVLEELVDAFARGDLRIEPVTFSMVFRFLVFKVKESKKNSK